MLGNPGRSTGLSKSRWTYLSSRQWTQGTISLVRHVLPRPLCPHSTLLPSRPASPNNREPASLDAGPSALETLALPSLPFPACCSASSPGYLTTTTPVRHAGRDEVGAGRPHLVTSSHTLGRDKHCHRCSPGGQDIPRWDGAALLPSFLCGGDGLAQAGPAAPVPSLLLTLALSSQSPRGGGGAAGL